MREFVKFGDCRLMGAKAQDFHCPEPRPDNSTGTVSIRSPKKCKVNLLQSTRIILRSELPIKGHSLGAF